MCLCDYKTSGLPSLSLSPLLTPSARSGSRAVASTHPSTSFAQFTCGRLFLPFFFQQRVSATQHLTNRTWRFCSNAGNVSAPTPERCSATFSLRERRDWNAGRYVSGKLSSATLRSSVYSAAKGCVQDVQQCLLLLLTTCLCHKELKSTQR